MSQFEDYITRTLSRLEAAGRPVTREAVIRAYEGAVAAGKIPRVAGDPVLSPPAPPPGVSGGAMVLPATPAPTPPEPPRGPTLPGPTPAPPPSEEEAATLLRSSAHNQRALTLIQQPGFDREEVLRLYNGLGAEVKGAGLAYLHVKRIMNLQQFFTPLEVTTLMRRMLDIPPRATVMDQTCGPGRMFWDVPTQGLCQGIEFDATAYTVAAAVYPKARLINDTAESHMWDEQFDYFLINPPFGLRWTDYRRLWLHAGRGGYVLSHYACLEQAIRGVKPGGYVAAVMPQGFWDRERYQEFKDWVRRQAKWVAHIALPSTTHVIAGSVAKGEVVTKGSRWPVELYIFRKYDEPLEAPLPEATEMNEEPPFQAVATSMEDLEGVLGNWRATEYWSAVKEYSVARDTTAPVPLEKVDRQEAEQVRLLGRGLRVGAGDAITASLAPGAMPDAFSEDSMALKPADKVAALKLAHAASYWPAREWDFVERTWVSPFDRTALLIGGLWSGDTGFDDLRVVRYLRHLGVTVRPDEGLQAFLTAKREWFRLQNQPFEHTANPNGMPDGWTQFNANFALAQTFPEVWAQAEEAFQAAAKKLPWMVRPTRGGDGKERMLFPFQAYDVKRMVPRAGVIYAAGMGTGKTLTSIAAAQSKLEWILKTQGRRGRVLVVAPPKLVDPTWQPTFEHEAGIGRVPELEPDDFKNPEKKLKGSQWAIVSYNTLAKNMGVAVWKEALGKSMERIVKDLRKRMATALEEGLLTPALLPAIINDTWSDILRPKNIPRLWSFNFLKPLAKALRAEVLEEEGAKAQVAGILDRLAKALAKKEAEEDEAEENPLALENPAPDSDTDPLGRPPSWEQEYDMAALENPAKVVGGAGQEGGEERAEDALVGERSQWPWFSSAIADTFDIVIVDEAHAIHKRFLTLPLALRRMKVRHWIALSVTGDAPVVIRKSGKVMRVSMKEAVELCGLHGEGTHANPTDVEVRSYDAQKRAMVWSKVTGCQAHKSPLPLVRIMAQFGIDLRVTENHSVYVIRDGCVEVPLAKDVRPGDLLIVDAAPNEWTLEPEATLNVLEHVIAPEQFIVYGREFAGLIPGLKGLKSHDRQNFKSGRYGPYIPYPLWDRAGRPGKPEWVSTRSGKRFHGARASIPVQAIARLVGLVAGDGWVECPIYRLCLAVANKDLPGVVHYLESLRPYFDFTWGVRQYAGSVNLRITSRPLGALFAAWFGGQKAPTKRLPRCVFNWPEEARREVLRGVIESDGHFDKAHQFYAVTSTSRELLYDVQALLLSLGVESMLYSRPHRDDPRPAFKNSRPSFSLNFMFPEDRKRRTFGEANIQNSGVTIWGAVAARVREVASEPNKEPMLYDFSVKGPENFVAGRVVCHNTGTPIKNRPKGLYALMEVIWRAGTAALPYQPGEFMDKFVTVIYQDRETGAQTTDKKLADTLWESENIRGVEIPLISNPLEFLMLLESKVIRRTKNEPDVQPQVQIPDPVMEFVNLKPEPELVSLYNQVMHDFRDLWREKINIERAARGAGEVGRGRGDPTVLAMINALRQLSAMPQFRPRADKPEIQAIIDQLPTYAGTLSAKQRYALDFLESHAKAGEKVIFIAETIATVEWFETELRKRGVDAICFTGQTGDVHHRAKIIAGWKDKPGGGAILATIKVMDTGLNVPQAKNTLIYEPSWNYADMEQAWSRMLRAKSSVGTYTVKVLMNKGLIDAYVWQLADYKRLATAEVVDRLEVEEYPDYYPWNDIMVKQLLEAGLISADEARELQSLSLTKEKKGEVTQRFRHLRPTAAGGWEEVPETQEKGEAEEKEGGKWRR